jgi:prepilin-type N-terminal cleavage/methylation domain-containing protein
MRHKQAGFTLIEVLISISLLGLLSTGMLMSISIALNSQEKANNKLMENRRVMGGQRALEEELNNFMPEMALYGAGRKVPFFDGEPETLRFVSSYSLNQAHRGLPQLLEFAVVSGDTGGFRLIVNEWPYRGSALAGEFIAGVEPGEDGQPHALFGPVAIGRNSFVLADRLASCKLAYLEYVTASKQWFWRPDWPLRQWPSAIRIEMVPLDGTGAKLHPMTVTAEVHAARNMDIEYKDGPK